MKENKSLKEQLNDVVCHTDQDLEKHIHHDKEYENIDHYHGKHHFDRFGNHDDIQNSNFELKTVFQFNRKKLIFKIVLTAIFLALTASVSALDILLESIQIPVSDQVWIQSRFLDISVVCISIATLGPIFASVLGFLAPILHNIIHGMEHGWIQPPIEAVINIFIVWIVFLIFNVMFNNSPIHHDTNKNVARFKRWTPLPIMSVLIAILSTLGFVLALYLDPSTNQRGLISNNSQLFFHAGHDHNHVHEENQLTFNNINMFIVIAVFGWNVLRYGIALLLFILVEWKMRPINHRYK
ncbi:ECF transporter S component [Mycoplasma feriruminatoris]|uniref:ECF transporter S component n=1 Tax=Mycoplasma feriruminatoris TaxID=1179777 RepID=UPI00241F7AE9|nr:ECF transporter S component [Mycoplasma feriruminatoris]WFQ91088.1 ECF transporter S component [Mycoplasma feriruminatoris]